MFEIKKLTVKAGEKTVLQNISLAFESGKTYALLGHNGSGKSSLALTIAGHPGYALEGGFITYDGKDITLLSVSERADLGIFLAFQNVAEIAGVRLSEFLRIAYNNRLKKNSPDTKPLSPFLFKRLLVKESIGLGIPTEFFDRDLFVGFSGWEKRRVELLAMKLLAPKVIILDEIDSGLDIDAFETISKFLASYKSSDRTIIIISHNFDFLDRIGVDHAMVLSDSRVVREWGREILKEIKLEGFESMKR